MGGEVGGGGRALGGELCLCCRVGGLSLALGGKKKGRQRTHGPLITVIRKPTG